MISPADDCGSALLIPMTLAAVIARATAIPMANCVMLFGMIASIHPMIADYGQRGRYGCDVHHTISDSVGRGGNAPFPRISARVGVGARRIEPRRFACRLLMAGLFLWQPTQ
jgi:hypothetical protein